MKRGRNQRRRPNNNPNRALDSNEPDVRIRGTANQIYDKYVALARDASSSGDRVKAENYLQHAEHYFRVIRVNQANTPSQSSPQPQSNQQTGTSGDGDQPSIEETRSADSDEKAPRQPRRNNRRPDKRTNDESAGDDAAPVEAAASDSAEVTTEDIPKPKRRRVKRTPKASADDETATAAAE